MRQELDLLRTRLPAVATLLRKRYGATRVVLFGSLAWGEAHATSDADLAISGVGAADAGVATADAEALLGRTVELFLLEELPASLRARVLTDGQELS